MLGRPAGTVVRSVRFTEEAFAARRPETGGPVTPQLAVLPVAALGATVAGAAVLLVGGGLALKLFIDRAKRAGTVVYPRHVDLDDAAAWVMVRLPREIGGLLSQHDVRRIIGWNLEYFRSRSTAGNGHGGQGRTTTAGSIIVAGAETVDYTLARADAAGAPYSAAQIHAVLAAQLRYLQAIGVAETGRP